MSNTIVTVVTDAGAALLSQVIADKGTISWISATSTSATPPAYASGDHVGELDLDTLKTWTSSNFSTKTSTGTVTAVNYKKDTVNNIDYLEVTCVLSSDTNVVPKLIGVGNVLGIYAKEDGTDDSTAILFAAAARGDCNTIHEFADGIDTVYFTFDVALRNTPVEDLAVTVQDNNGFYALASDLTTFKDSLWKRGTAGAPDTGAWPSFKSEMTEWADGLYKDNSPEPATGTLATFKSSLETWRDELWTKPNPSAGIVESGEWPTFKNELYTWKDALYKDNSPDPPTGLWPAFKAEIQESSGVRVETIQTITGAKTFTPTSVAGVTDSSEQGDAAVNGISFVKDDNGAGNNTVIMPTSNNTCYIGTTDNRFNSMYTYSLYCTDNITCGNITASGNITVTGNINVSGVITGTVTSASYATSAGSATSASYATSSGSATNAINIYVTTTSSSNSYPLVFMSSTSAGSSVSSGNKSLYTDNVNSCYYNPSTNTLKCDNFSGTATKAISDESGNNIKSNYATSLTTSTSSNITNLQLLNKNSASIGSSINLNNIFASICGYVSGAYAGTSRVGSIGLFVYTGTSRLYQGDTCNGSNLRQLTLRFQRDSAIGSSADSTSFILNSQLKVYNHSNKGQAGTWRALHECPAADTSGYNYGVVLAIRIS